MSSAATRMDLNIIVLSETGQRKTSTIWCRLHVESKNDTNELIYKNRNRLTDSENKLMITKGEEGVSWIRSLRLADTNHYIHCAAQSIVVQSYSTLCDPLDPWLTRPLYPLGFSGKNTGVNCHFPPPGDLSNSGIKSMSPVSPALQADSLPSEPLGKPKLRYIK